MKVRTLRITFFALLTFVLILALFPTLFKGKLEDIARAEFSKVTGISISFERLSVNAFRHFPNLSATFHGVTLTSAAPFDSLKIATIGKARAALDLSSLLNKSKPVTITRIYVGGANFQWLTLPSGASNLDFIFANRQKDTIALPEKPKKKSISIRLNSIRLQNINFSWDDQAAQTRFGIEKLSFTGDGDYNEDLFRLNMDADIPGVDFSSGGIAYLTHASLAGKGILEIDLANQVYRLNEGKLKLNELSTQIAGEISFPEGGIYTDLNFKTADNSFKSLLSLIPNAYTANFSEVKADGFFDLEGSIKGTLDSISDNFPSFHLGGTIRDGRFNYPNLPLGLEKISASLEVIHPGENLDNVSVSLPQIRFLLDGEPFSAGLKAGSLISDPLIDFFAEGAIDLYKLYRAFPFPSADSLSGMVNSNIKLSGTQSTLKTEGAIETSDIYFKGTDMPELSIGKTHAVFSNQELSFHAEDASVADTRFTLDVVLADIFSFLKPEAHIPIEVQFGSPEIKLDDWLSESPAVEPTEVSETAIYLPDFADRLQLKFRANAGKIIFEKDTILNSSLIAGGNPERIELQSFKGQKNQSDWDIKGSFEGLSGYLLREEMLSGMLTIESKIINFNDFIPVSESDTLSEASSDEMENVLIPNNLNIGIEAKIEKLLFGKLTLTGVKGSLHLADHRVNLDDFSAESLGGRVQFSGSYSTPDSESPTFALYYDLRELDFQQSFTQVNTFRAFFPIGKFVAGTYSSNLYLSGKLNTGMIPDLSSMEGKGYLETHNAIVTDLPIFRELGRQLNLNALQQPVNIGSTKNWFEVREGFVEVPDFNLKVGQTAMVIGGRHGIDRRLDYLIQTEIPANKLAQTALVENVLQSLNIKDESGIGEVKDLKLKVSVDLAGTVEKPKFKINKIGVSASENQNREKDVSLANKIGEQLGVSVDSLGEKAKDLFGGLRPDSLAGNLKAAPKDSLEKVIEDLKKELEKLNPFKKKKNNQD